MASLTDMVPSKSNYLSKKDTDENGVDLVIKKFAHEDVGQGADKETRLVVYWTDPNYKPMVINKSNANRIKRACGTDDPAQLVGRAVCVYVDPDVEFGGETVGGLRIKPARNGGGVAASRQAPRQDDMGPPTPPLESYTNQDMNDEIPF